MTDLTEVDSPETQKGHHLDASFATPLTLVEKGSKGRAVSEECQLESKIAGLLMEFKPKMDTTLEKYMSANVSCLIKIAATCPNRLRMRVLKKLIPILNVRNAI
ncbi:hypothetical protein K4G60_g2830 [Candida parapsilosis]|nr:hypothetical protein K4G60_g2830 [Candida parapsilosis]KAI5907664.1 hypothetical protein K4G61_g1326 [Candida parapsilosis]